MSLTMGTAYPPKLLDSLNGVFMTRTMPICLSPGAAATAARTRIFVMSLFDLSSRIGGPLLMRLLGRTGQHQGSARTSLHLRTVPELPSPASM
jgi:hypothetical protein